MIMMTTKPRQRCRRAVLRMIKSQFKIMQMAALKSS